MRVCSDPGKLRRKRMLDGGMVSALLLCGILAAHSIRPMDTWSVGGFWMLWFAVIIAGAWVSIRPRMSGSHACFDDEGISVQLGRGTRRLAWHEVSAVSRSEYAPGAYRLDFEDPQGRNLRVDLAMFLDAKAVFTLVRRHLAWVDAEHWTGGPAFRVEKRT